MLSVAKKHLDNFNVVGITERFDESFALLKHTFRSENLNEIAPIREKNDGQVMEWVDEVREMVLEFNQLDVELLRYAHTLLDRKSEQLGLNNRTISIEAY